MKKTKTLSKPRGRIKAISVWLQGRFGLDSAGVEWEDAGTVWAAVDFVKGVQAMREGAIDVYGVVMVLRP